MTGLALRSVAKRYGDSLILDHVSLEIGPQEFVVVLGPSGCGKSTLLRVVAGLEPIDSGEIEIGGKRVDHLPPGKRGVALVFQSYALYPHMTVRDNLAFGLRNAKVASAEIDRRIADAARILEIEPFLERRPAELSGGQRQRVAIGRAIVKEPALFMFDEPLSNLDAALRNRTRQEIANLHRRIRTATLFVTHDQTEAMTLADRIVVMNRQRIEQVGSPAEIYARPATAFVAAFVGTPSMNLLPAAALALTAMPDGTVQAGLRPEALSLSAAGAGDQDATVEFVEFLGDRKHVFLRLAGGERVVALAGAACAVEIGATAGLTLDRGAAHFFGSDGRNLLAGAP